MANINVIVGRPKILVVRASHALLLAVVCFSHPHTFFLSSQMGDPAVGKSALTQMFHSNGQRFPKAYNMTCGVDFSAKAVNIPDTEEAIELHIFDTAGQVGGAYFSLFPATSLSVLNQLTSLARSLVFRTSSPR